MMLLYEFQFRQWCLFQLVCIMSTEISKTVYMVLFKYCDTIVFRDPVVPPFGNLIIVKKGWSILLQKNDFQFFKTAAGHLVVLNIHFIVRHKMFGKWWNPYGKLMQV